MKKNMSLRYTWRKCSFPGRIYVPRDQDIRGGILVLHGSEGSGFGIHDNTAMLLACHGFTALAYDWCGSHERPIDGLPSKVVDIPIEGPVKALRWLQRHKSVRNKPVAIYGVSRGAELAMIIATLPRDRMVPRLAAVSSLSGTDRIVQGFSWKWNRKSRKKASHRRLDSGPVRCVSRKWQQPGDCGKVRQPSPRRRHRRPTDLRRCRGRTDQSFFFAYHIGPRLVPLSVPSRLAESFWQRSSRSAGGWWRKRVTAPNNFRGSRRRSPARYRRADAM